jgi:glutathione S-transferase
MAESPEGERMRLHWSPRSPFVRKVMIAAHELGLADRIDCVRTVVRMTQPNAELLPENPLSKIPTLVLADGRVLMDSLTICEYLDWLAQGTLFPVPGPRRWEVQSRQALANGLLDILILWRNERDKPPSAQLQVLHDSFAVKTRATLAQLERDAGWFEGEAFSIAHVTTGVLLAYVDFRFPDLGWREGHPRLAAWHRGFAERPSMLATGIVDDA